MSKTKSQLETELKELKARMRTLAEVQAEAVAAAPAAVAEEEAAPEAHSGLAADFEELLDVLKRDIEGVPVMTGITIFGLGVLTGRLLAH